MRVSGGTQLSDRGRRPRTADPRSTAHPRCDPPVLGKSLRGGYRAGCHERRPAAVDGFVQQVVAATCGHLYKPLTGRLARYPIPELPLSHGDGGVLLDLGCNWGRWTVAAARRGWRAVGIDPDLDAILAAGRVARELGVAAAFIVADARWLPFASHAFDAVFSYSVLQHFGRKDVETALAEVSRVLKSRGTSLVQMANRWGLRSSYHQLRRGFREARSFEVRYWTPGELRAVFSRHLGPTVVTADAYLGLGLQRSDIDLLPRRYQLVVRASQVLKACGRVAPWMTVFADSLYVRSTVSAESDVRE